MAASMVSMQAPGGKQYHLPGFGLDGSDEPVCRGKCHIAHPSRVVPFGLRLLGGTGYQRIWTLESELLQVVPYQNGKL
ncbi:unnamed protein product [Clonostachys solani]|uniref:Uncharacterized protein n=1 Tax=Clonostachys solani TaxID=160281 RepID=A0A9P0EJ73_9HYPO|nr:unnamed protein product [Clonostachys solani]